MTARMFDYPATPNERAGVAQSTISQIKSGARWSAIPTQGD